MTRTRMLILAVVMSGAACSSGEVALNERMFAVPSMELEGAGCTLYDLADDAMLSTETVALGLTVRLKANAGAITVVVTEGDMLITTRTYDHSFFRIGSVDEFRARSSSGSELLLRYWGKVNPDGMAGCAPLDTLTP